MSCAIVLAHKKDLSLQFHLPLFKNLPHSLLCSFFCSQLTLKSKKLNFNYFNYYDMQSENVFVTDLWLVLFGSILLIHCICCLVY